VRKKRGAVPIDVALVQAPGLLGDLLERVIQRDPEFHLVARVEDPISGGSPFRGRVLDAVIAVTPDGSIPADQSPLHGWAGSRAFVAVAADGKHASLRSVTGPDAALADFAPGELTAALQHALARANEGGG
jgi:hypothetical protein